VIRLHRLSARAEAFYLNPDLIITIDSTLTTHQKVLVSDPPEDVVRAIHEWRSTILAAAMPATPKRRNDAGLMLVKATAAPAPNHDLQENDR
jgi:uncharacterized protein YlzI (FlbEa/FlbD family)